MRVLLYSWYQMKPWGIDSGRRLAVMESIILMCRSFSGLLVFPSWPWKNNDNKHHNITTTNHEYQQYDSKHQLFLRLLGWSLEIGSTSRLWGISKFRFPSGKRNQIKTYAIICRATGSVSTIASACLIVHNLQSHHGILVSTITYHRLVFGLSITDILSSFAHALGSTMVPKEMNFFYQAHKATCQLALLRDSTILLELLARICTIVQFVSITLKSSGIIRRMNTFGISWNPGFMWYLS